MERQNILALRRKMKEAAFNDPLTGGISNAAFLLRVQEKLEKEPQRPYVMAFLNIRGFKNINELYGVETGNTLLKQIYNILKRSIRKEEIVTRSECDHYFMLLEGDREERVRERLEQMLEEVSGA